MDRVCQEFDVKSLTFTKADQKEVLFQFEEQDEHEEENEEEESGRTEFIERGEIGKSPNLVLINVSPIENAATFYYAESLRNAPATNFRGRFDSSFTNVRGE